MKTNEILYRDYTNTNTGYGLKIYRRVRGDFYCYKYDIKKPNSQEEFVGNFKDENLIPIFVKSITGIYEL